MRGTLPKSLRMQGLPRLMLPCTSQSPVAPQNPKAGQMPTDSEEGKR